LDPQSRTSNNLAQVLLKNFWKINPELVNHDQADAFVQIGDRTFGKKEQFPYSYDLAQEWFNFTGLPFAFAVWASNKPISETFKISFNEALKLGLDHKEEVLKNLDKVENFDLDNYLMKKVDFILDAEKLKAIDKFHQLIKAL
jgi:chorismate dehydratase